MKTYLLPIVISLLLFSFSVPAQDVYSSLSECENEDSYDQIQCYTQFAKQNNDVSVCLKAKGIWAYLTKGECAAELALLNNDVSICNSMDPTDAGKQVCLEMFYVEKKDKTGCKKIEDTYWKELCLSRVGEYGLAERAKQFQTSSIWLFFVSLILAIVVALFLLFLKIRILNYLLTLTLLLSPTLFFLRFILQFPFHGYPVLLFYGVFCTLLVILNLKKSFKEWLNNDPLFKRDIKLTYLYSLLFVVALSFMSLSDYGGGEILKIYTFRKLISTLLWGLVQWGEVYLPVGLLSWGGMLLPISIASIVYTIKASNIKNKQEGFLIYTALASIGFTILGVISILCLFLAHFVSFA